MTIFKRFILIVGLVWAFILITNCAPHHKHKNHKKRHSAHLGNATIQNALKSPELSVTRKFTPDFSDALCNNLHFFKKDTRKSLFSYLHRRCDHGFKYVGAPSPVRLRPRRKSSRDHNKKKEERKRKAYKKVSRLYEKAKCQVLNKIVELEVPPRNARRGERYFPCMVPVKRCTGCCLSDLQQCVPTKTRMRKFKISIAWEVRNNIDKSKIGKKFVKEHLDCQCKCKIKPSDCGPGQIYEEKSCMCSCPTGSHKECPHTKMWNESECKCICRNVQECTTGLVFKHDTCSCEQQQNYLDVFYHNDLS